MQLTVANEDKNYNSINIDCINTILLKSASKKTRLVWTEEMNNILIDSLIANNYFESRSSDKDQQKGIILTNIKEKLSRIPAFKDSGIETHTNESLRKHFNDKCDQLLKSHGYDMNTSYDEELTKGQISEVDLKFLTQFRKLKQAQEQSSIEAAKKLKVKEELNTKGEALLDSTGNRSLLKNSHPEKANLKSPAVIKLGKEDLLDEDDESEREEESVNKKRKNINVTGGHRKKRAKQDLVVHIDDDDDQDITGVLQQFADKESKETAMQENIVNSLIELNKKLVEEKEKLVETITSFSRSKTRKSIRIRKLVSVVDRDLIDPKYCVVTTDEDL